MHPKSRVILTTAVVVALFWIVTASPAQAPADPLAAGFQNPPDWIAKGGWSCPME
jgi:hypothetical protein